MAGAVIRRPGLAGAARVALSALLYSGEAEGGGDHFRGGNSKVKSPREPRREQHQAEVGALHGNALSEMVVQCVASGSPLKDQPEPSQSSRALDRATLTQAARGHVHHKQPLTGMVSRPVHLSKTRRSSSIISSGALR